MTAHFLEIRDLAKRFPDPDGQGEFTVFEDINFDIEEGEFVCIIGHSGCGKSTILNVLAGLDEPSQGGVVMAGKEVTGPSLDRGVVFQNHSLLPWKTAIGNVRFAVQARHKDWSRRQVIEHSRRYLSMVGLEQAQERYPAQLSGGMRQRVGIARAFANQPKLLLMDEPFGALDALTRGTIQDELVRIWSGTGQTVFMITHDVDEAILLADRVLLMSNGPHARVAESVRINLPRPRDRAEILQDPAFYTIRNHLMHFLVERSRQTQGGGEAADRPWGSKPPEIDPTAAATGQAPAPPAGAGDRPQVRAVQ